MGQYFNGASYSLKDSKIEEVEKLKPWDYENGGKISEHSYIGNNYVNMVEKMISSTGRWYGKCIVWAGDYEDVFSNEKRIYEMGKTINPEQQSHEKYKYLVNKSKKLYVIIKKTPIGRFKMQLHPLPFLTSNSDGFSGKGNRELVGSWCGDVITVSNKRPVGFKELIFDLSE